ncbi:hypothetical protein SUGI_0068020 [Cryptomeria japonica]|uniref:uncharacterized protein LOC131060229 n=1 Tax=Cryptomeria japonica TaxID=3369 RepID=UPI002408E1AE|nr:uncharacterized protein LOC131060229 [Cryptomeria japonica]GLJ07483.1 hypothetical protein SUGI_0068020 [Cryptomeria japonica]
MDSNSIPCTELRYCTRLRTECKFLRVQKDLAVTMQEQDSLKLESTMRVVHSLTSVLSKAQGRETCDKGVDMIEKSTPSIQIKILQERLQKLRSKSELRETEVKEVCRRNTCQAAIRNVAEQVKAESGQLWEMQLLLGVLDKQVQELHNSRDLWRCKAFRATREAEARKEMVQQWQHKARSSQKKLWHLESQMTHLKIHPHFQSDPMLYHETTNGSDKRDKIDKKCWNTVEEKNSNSNLNNSKTGELKRVLPKRQAFLDVEGKVRADNVNGQHKKSECGKKNIRQDLHVRNQSSTRCPLQNISNVIDFSLPPS